MRRASAAGPLRHRLAVGLWSACALGLLWAALAPLHPASRERTIDIAAASGAELPTAITLTLGAQDVLLLRNFDHVPQRFGPLLLAPGEQFRLPFEQTGVYPIAAGAWPGQTLTVTVVDWPVPGWERIKWRAAALGHALRYLPTVPRPASASLPSCAGPADRAPALCGSGIMPA